MSLSPSPLQWPGPMFASVDLPYSDGLMAGLTGSVVSLQGSDPVGYARDVLASWAQPASDKLGSVQQPTPAAPASFSWPSLGALADAEFWKRAGINVGAGLFAIALVILGLYFLIRGGD